MLLDLDAGNLQWQDDSPIPYYTLTELARQVAAPRSWALKEADECKDYRVMVKGGSPSSLLSVRVTLYVEEFNWD